VNHSKIVSKNFVVWYTCYKPQKIDLRHKYVIWWMVTWRIVDDDVECLHVERSPTMACSGSHLYKFYRFVCRGKCVAERTFWVTFIDDRIVQKTTLGEWRKTSICYSQTNFHTTRATSNRAVQVFLSMKSYCNAHKYRATHSISICTGMHTTLNNLIIVLPYKTTCRQEGSIHIAR
jgi:hypothetical protein